MLINRRYILVSAFFAIVSVFLASLSFALAHGSPAIAAFAFGLLLPSILLGKLLGMQGALTVSTFAFVFATQFVFSYTLCAIHFIFRRNTLRDNDKNQEL